MKIVIEYRRGVSAVHPCVATAAVKDICYCGVGATWEAAKECLLRDIKEGLRIAPPPAKEEVEIETEAK